MDVNTGKLYNDEDMKSLEEKLTGAIVKLNKAEEKSLTPKEIVTKQASKRTMRAVRKRIARQMKQK